MGESCVCDVKNSLMHDSILIVQLPCAVYFKGHQYHFNARFIKFSNSSNNTEEGTKENNFGEIARLPVYTQHFVFHVYTPGVDALLHPPKEVVHDFVHILLGQFVSHTPLARRPVW